MASSFRSGRSGRSGRAGGPADDPADDLASDLAEGLSDTLAEGLNRPEDETLERLRPHLGRLPLFPLPQVQLFPGILLPLYVFEPRYREMTASCLLEGRAMAVGCLQPGYEADYQGRPPVHPIAGAGLLLAHRLNPDGTYNILLQGVARVRIDAELPPDEARAYREVRATLLVDECPPDYDVALAREALISLVDRVAAELPDAGDPLRTLCRSSERPGVLADALGAALIAGSARRQELLQTVDVSLRLEQVSAAVARLLAQLTRRGPGSN